MPFLATMPITMISPMNDAMLKSVRVMSSARKTPEVDRMAEARIESGAANVRNSNSSTMKYQHDSQQQDQHQVVERLLLLFVGSAVHHAYGRRQVEVVYRLLHRLDRAAQVGAFQPRRHGHVALQVLAANLVLAGHSLTVASVPSVAVWPAELLSSVLLIASSELRFASG